MDEVKMTEVEQSRHSHASSDSSAPIPADGARTVDPADSAQSTPDVEAARPSDPSAVRTVVCARCQTSNPTDAELCSQCKSFLLKNQKSRRSGTFAKYQPADVILTADELFDGVVSDKGGVAEMSTLKRSLAAKLRDADILLSLNKRTIVKDGVETPTGRRAHDRYLAALDRFVRLAMLLGLDREAKRVPTLNEIMHSEEGADGSK